MITASSPGGQIPPVAGKVLRLLAGTSHEQLKGLLPCEGKSACQKLIKGCCQAVHVRGKGGRLAADHLRRRQSRGSEDAAGGGEPWFFNRLGQAKIRHKGPQQAVYQEVLRLDIAMEDPHFVAVADGVKDRISQLEKKVGFQGTVFFRNSSREAPSTSCMVYQGIPRAWPKLKILTMFG